MASSDLSTADLHGWLNSRAKSPLLLFAVIGFGIVWLVAKWLDFPVDRHFHPSILAQHSMVAGLLAAILGTALCCFIVRIFQRSPHAEDPLFAAAAGLAALSWRGGTMTALLQNSSLSVFIVLIFEILLLAGVLGGWYLLIARWNHAQPVERDWNSMLLSAGCSIVIMTVCMYLLAQTDAKKQVLAAVAISGFAAAAASHSFFEVDDSLPYLSAPVVLGVVGYVIAYVLPGAAWHIGRVSTPLAYALPLDYLSVGIVGSLFGLWTSQSWKQQAAG